MVNISNKRANCAVVFLLAIGLMLSGCADNPKRKAANEVNRAIVKATKMVELYKVGEEIDYISAIKELHSVYPLVSKAGPGAEKVFVTAGDLSAAYALGLSKGMPGYEIQVIQAAKSCGDDMLGLMNLKVEYDINKVLEKISLDEAETLEEVLEGSQTYQGVREKLNSKQAELEELGAELEKYQNVAKQAQGKADAVQLEADGLIRKSEMAAGDAKLALEKKAYDLIKGYTNEQGVFVKGKIHYSAEVQKAIDLAEIVQEKIQIVEPLVMKLGSDLQLLKQRIAELTDEDKKFEHIKYLTILEGQMEEKEKSTSEKLADLEEKLADYKSQFVKCVDAYSDSVEDYDRVRSREYKGMADVEMAESKKELAKLYISDAVFAQRVLVYLNSFVELNEGDFKVKCQELGAEYTQRNQDSFAAALECFDDSIDSLESVMSGKASDELAERAVRYFLLIANERLNYASASGDKDKVDELIGKVEEYKEIAIKADPYFSKSIIAKLYQPYSIDFRTEEELLLEKYDELKLSFTDCLQLEGDVRKETLVSLLSELYEMNRPRDMKYYEEYVKYVWESFKDDWMEINKTDKELVSMTVLESYVQAELEKIQEEAGGDVPGGYESGARDMFGEPNSN